MPSTPARRLSASLFAAFAPRLCAALSRRVGAPRAEALTLAAEIGESLDAQRHARWWSSPPLALLRTPIADT